MEIKKKTLYYGIASILIILLLIFIVPKYFTGNVTASGIPISSEVEKIEIYHFHGNNQCSSCIAVGKLAEETINTYYQNEIKSGKIVFSHINAELPENIELARKYDVTGSSLWIGTYTKDGKFYKEENTNVWYKINNKQDYLNYLKGLIDKKLSGQ